MKEQVEGRKMWSKKEESGGRQKKEKSRCVWAQYFKHDTTSDVEIYNNSVSM